VFFALTARFSVRQFRRNVRARAEAPAAGDDMADDAVQSSRDWLSSPRTNLVAWWIPQAAILAGLFVPVPVRTAVWVIALTWMGTACILNARRCRRTHCRFTGPFYLAMIIPLLTLGLVSYSVPAWLVLGAFIIFGDKVIWWATERAWGKFS
jgi:hypothetical protein